MSLLTTLTKIIQDSNHKLCTAAYLFEHLQAPVFESSGELNLAIHKEADKLNNLPVFCETGYIHTGMVLEECKEKVSKQFIQDRADVAFGVNEIALSTSGFVYSYGLQ